MIFVFDLLVAAFLVAVVLSHQPILGIYVLLLTLFFGAQYWKTLLLLGRTKERVRVSRKVMAGILAIVFSALLGVVLQLQSAPVEEKSFTDLWNDDLFPVFMAISLLSALLLATLVTERRKR